MRKDFNRVLTEDPRRGSRNKFGQIRRCKLNSIFDEEFSGGKESIMAQRRNQKKQDRKRFGDLLNPLERWVRKQVGKNWDVVYSEVSELFDRRSQIKDHVHQHLLLDFVETKTKLIDGVVCTFNAYDGWTPVAKSWRRNFYVHPTTKILCTTEKDNDPSYKVKEAEELKTRQDAVFRVVDKDHHLYFQDGVWWVFAIVDRTPPTVRYVRPWRRINSATWDALTTDEKKKQGDKEYVYQDAAVPAPAVPGYGYRQSPCPSGRYYFKKRIAGRKLLKRFGLVGTAEFKEDSAARSRRELFKYR
jgi:hypothetical protein